MRKSLDLHGYKITQTSDIVESFIIDQQLFGTQEAHIITGDNKIIKSSVKKIVKNLGLECKEHLYTKQVLTIIF